MGFFRREETESRDINRARQDAPGALEAPPSQIPEDRVLVAGDWAEGDPRRARHEVLVRTGLAWVCWWTREIEPLWEAVVEASPTLGRLIPLGNGFSKLRSDENTYAVGVDGPRGSAMVIVATEDSDFLQMIQDIQDPLKGLDGLGITLSLMNQGNVDRRAADIVDTGAQVSLAEMVRNEGSTAKYSLLPPWARRGLTSWTEVNHDLYRREVADSEGDVMAVYCSLWEGCPTIVYPFFKEVSEGQFAQLRPLGEYVDGELFWMDPQAAVVHSLRRDELPDQAAQSIVDGIARGLVELRPTLGGPSAT